MSTMYIMYNGYLSEFACNCAMHISYKIGWKQGQKLFKKESDVGMLLTSIQSTETRCM